MSPAHFAGCFVIRFLILISEEQSYEYKKYNQRTENIFNPVEYPVAVSAWQRYDEFCTDSLALPEDRFRIADGASVNLFLCALCAAQYFCRRVQRPVG